MGLDTLLQEPSHILYISPHHSFTKSIRVLNLTEQLLSAYLEYNRDIDCTGFRDRLKQVIKKIRENEDKCEELFYLIKKAKWNAGPYYLIPAKYVSQQEITASGTERIDMGDKDDENDTATAPDEQLRLAKNAIATLQVSSIWSYSFLMLFPDGSPHSSHSIEIKRGTLVPRTQVFVKDSIQYDWEMGSARKDYRQTLVKKLPDGKTAAALFRRLQYLKGPRGILLVVDDKIGIDHVVAILATFGTFKSGGG
ncbi:hypothetical protein V1509DRAFT_613377 [Lipomyces kononenkoae]